MASPETESLTLPVIGMTCASCQHHVENALNGTAGVKSAHVDLMANRASIVFDPGEASAARLVEAIPNLIQWGAVFGPCRVRGFGLTVGRAVFPGPPPFIYMEGLETWG